MRRANWHSRRCTWLWRAHCIATQDKHNNQGGKYQGRARENTYSSHSFLLKWVYSHVHTQVYPVHQFLLRVGCFNAGAYLRQFFFPLFHE